MLPLITLEMPNFTLENKLIGKVFCLVHDSLICWLFWQHWFIWWGKSRQNIPAFFVFVLMNRDNTKWFFCENILIVFDFDHLNPVLHFIFKLIDWLSHAQRRIQSNATEHHTKLENLTRHLCLGRMYVVIFTCNLFILNRTHSICVNICILIIVKCECFFFSSKIAKNPLFIRLTERTRQMIAFLDLLFVIVWNYLLCLAAKMRLVFQWIVWSCANKMTLNISLLISNKLVTVEILSVLQAIN